VFRSVFSFSMPERVLIPAHISRIRIRRGKALSISIEEHCILSYPASNFVLVPALDPLMKGT
jgi:hypothetical protein